MAYDKNNIFAKIIRGELPCSKVYEDDEVLAFHDISKAASVHILVVPKGEYIDFADFVSRAGGEEVKNFFDMVAKIAKSQDLAQDQYRLITNKGLRSGQSVFHFHVHILAGQKIGKLL